jgi:integrase
VKHDTKNLVKRGNVWWFRKVIRGDLHWFALDTGSLPEARTRRERYLTDLADGRRARSSKKTFDDLLTLFRSDHMPTLKPSSQQRYKDSIKHLSAHFGRKPLSAVSSATLKAFEAKRRAQGVSNPTIRRDLACLSSMMSLAEEEEWIVGNPVRPFLRQRSKRGLTESPPETRHLSHEEEAAVLQAAGSDKIRQLIAFAIDTGLRRAELFQLEWRDIDLSANLITIRAEIAKSGRERRVPMLDRCRDLLTRMSETRPNSPFVFPRDDGGPFSPRSPHMWNELQAALKRAGITEHASWHDLRRTCGCRLLNDLGLQMHEVSVWLGHSSVSVTERHYAFLKHERLRDRVNEQYANQRVKNDLTINNCVSNVNQILDQPQENQINTALLEHD